MKPSDIPPTRDAALTILKTALIEKKMTQCELADAADCHEKTVQNLLSGRTVRDQTLFDVCMVLGLDFESVKIAWTGSDTEPVAPANNTDMAPLYMGGYTRQVVDHYIGSYLTLRPAFDASPQIIAFRTDIFWSDLASALCFREKDRPDDAYSHRGHLYIPTSSMFIHLVSLTKGAMRMVLVSQIDQFGMMRGIISTLNKAIGSAFTPVAAPIIYERIEDVEAPSYGTIAADHDAFAGYQAKLLQATEQQYVRLLGMNSL